MGQVGAHATAVFTIARFFRGDVARIAVELEKLSLFAGAGKTRSHARFAGALYRRSIRCAAMAGICLWRLVARESGLRSAEQIQGRFSKVGVPMWGSRTEQVKLKFEGDRDLRSARPDDRAIIEQFPIRLTAL